MIRVCTSAISSTVLLVCATTAVMGAFGSWDFKSLASGGALIDKHTADPEKLSIGVYPSLPTGERFDARQLGVGNTYGANSAVFGVLVPPTSKRAFPTTLTVFTEMASAGGQGFSLYAPSYLLASGVATSEIDAFNMSADAPASYPWSRGFGTRDNLAIAISCIMDGLYINAACMEIGNNDQMHTSAQYGITVHAGAIRQAALIVDATAAASPKSDLILRHSGNTGEPIISLETKGEARNAAPILRHRNAAGTITYQLNQDGSVVGSVRTLSMFNAPLHTPVSSRSPCTIGDSFDDENYHYVCTARNRLRRVRLSDF